MGCGGLQNQREYDEDCSIPGLIFERSEANQASFPPGAQHDLNGGRKMSFVPPGLGSQRVPRGIQRNVDESRGAAVVS